MGFCFSLSPSQASPHSEAKSAVVEGGRGPRGSKGGVPFAAQVVVALQARKIETQGRASLVFVTSAVSDSAADLSVAAIALVFVSHYISFWDRGTAAFLRKVSNWKKELNY